ncbi:MAG: helix-turn-helix transcriptional regulator [Aquamicrobium sp.]|uniref:winged helix-turn-helix transcriptional regulator n=1 Tax=Mesorhizobium sp. Pch-S TaxID=2082387 RepID=UPI00101058FB|nr:helix-turn-helix domain-containing protein [Mesorhizobium sp. Pch-S]MBR2688326.1 helix-turn-helix transcriptional regulator [Aquamicrobium sp.]QAZ44361.1 transcriptional regulator [Mesorhizobium sp. Pch-S]
MIRLDRSHHARPDEIAEAGRRFKPSPSNGVCTRLGDKWTVLVLWRLSIAPGRRLRFSGLKNEVEGITQRMLTLTLRNLERDGLVARHYFPEVPPRVEYQLTEMGTGILSALEGLNFWIQDNLPRIEQSRRAYDDAGP